MKLTQLAIAVFVGLHLLTVALWLVLFFLPATGHPALPTRLAFPESRNPK